MPRYFNYMTSLKGKQEQILINKACHIITAQCNCSSAVFQSNNVQRSVCRANVACCHENYIDYCPDTKASETEQLANAFTPETKVEAIGTKSSKCDTATNVHY